MIYFVATPIGNLKDITLRALEVLNSVDIIACEDTRNSLKLLNHYNISKKLIAYHKFNEKTSAEGIIKLALQGKNIAVISDSGMPIISDPGWVLIERLIKEDIKYTVIPGASASLSALLLSGFNATNFTFVGFLDENAKLRQQQIDNVKEINSTLIFYVSPYNLQKDIKFLYQNLGERKACLVNEITKIYEKTIRFDLCENFDNEIKGECVLIVEGKTKQDFKNSPKEYLFELIKNGISKNDAIKIVAKERHIPKNEIYKLTLKD